MTSSNIQSSIYEQSQRFLENLPEKLPHLFCEQIEIELNLLPLKINIGLFLSKAAISSASSANLRLSSSHASPWQWTIRTNQENGTTDLSGPLCSSPKGDIVTAKQCVLETK